MKKVIVIGNGMVGYKFCEKLAAHPQYKDFTLTVFGEEGRPAYDRVHLSEYVSQNNADQLTLAPAKWYTEHQIDLRLAELITNIDPIAQTVTSHKDQTYTYDYLILATGSSPFVPNLQGRDKKGVFVYRTIEDIDGIREYTKKLKTQGKSQAIVMGGGLLGLEAANCAKNLGLNTTVVELSPRLMPRQLDQTASDILQETIEGMDIKILLDKATQSIEGGNHIESIQFKDGSQLKTDILIVSAGIRPRDELGRKIGLTLGERGGIVVNPYMQTSIENIYAIGEVACYNRFTYGLVAPGYEMAAIAVDHLTGGKLAMKEFIDLSTQLKLIGTEVASFGDPFIEGSNVRVIKYENKLKGIYKRINISKDGRQLLGGILVGDNADYNALFQLYINKLKLSDHPEDYLLGARNGDSSVLGSVLDLPDTAQICSCENVTKQDIQSKIKDETCHSIKDIVQCTKATTGCGGCKPMVVDLINESLKSMGKTVKETICSHFEYSRQELYTLIKYRKIKTYDDALDKLGQGHGCEICKPVLASLFASIYMETANQQPTIQDSNDRFLANIQRNGSYSVVPRVPGGEISPQKLIVIGQIAEKYNLYTKITGGQRIDLFGAELHQLPLIWKELIEAGFESGHAYGKSLRTVKSCVGSTWCRYGMHESVSFAIELEERYKGLRSPHKIKGGVSGCIRECAEARGKDFGIIAVEEGWNLYICGNGGSRPKHAVLLAEKLDNATCVQYLDRFLMFYIRTAAPLMRTATWLEKLDGGLDYLKEVIIHDSLGIAKELEEEMQSLVNAYECEWKQAIDNPEFMKRFKHFVNSEDSDDNISYVPLRDQKMPKAWTK